MGKDTKFKSGNSGKPKGATNHLTKTVKETVLKVFNDIQSDPKSNLTAFAKKYPKDFYNIAAKLIPTEVDAKVKSETHLIQFYLPDNGRTNDNKTTEGLSREGS